MSSSSSKKSTPKLCELVVGDAYEKTLINGSKTPWLDENKELQKQVSENRWTRWDGVEGTAQDHLKWMHEQAVSILSDDRRTEFRSYGEKNGCAYYIHDELTNKAGGYGFFKIEATLRLEPKDMVARAFDMGGLREIDKTVVMMKVLKEYHLDDPKNSSSENNNDNATDGDIGVAGDDFPVCAAIYWCNDPGFPFYYRDGVDLSGYTKDKDDENVLWQVSVSARGNGFVSMPGGLAATDRYWAYKLEPTKLEDGSNATKTTLICQTELNGYIPIFLSNYFLCSVLIDYMATTEKTVEKKKKTGEHQNLLKQINLL